MLFLKLREPADSPGTKSGPANSGLLVRPTGYNPGSRGDGRHWPGPDVRVFYFELFATKRSPRRVQTDAYHRP